LSADLQLLRSLCNESSRSHVDERQCRATVAHCATGQPCISVFIVRQHRQSLVVPLSSSSARSVGDSLSHCPARLPGHADNALHVEFRPLRSTVRPPETENRELHQSWRAVCAAAASSIQVDDLSLSALYRTVTTSSLNINRLAALAACTLSVTARRVLFHRTGLIRRTLRSICAGV